MSAANVRFSHVAGALFALVQRDDGKEIPIITPDGRSADLSDLSRGGMVRLDNVYNRVARGGDRVINPRS